MGSYIGNRRLIHPTANIYDSRIGRNTKVAAFAEIGGSVVGDRCKIEAFAFICPGVTIGDEVFVGPHACFTNDRHPKAVGEWIREETVVKSGASIGASCVILPGVVIGENAVIGAGSVVVDDVPDGATVAGNPARSYGQAISEASGCASFGSSSVSARIGSWLFRRICGLSYRLANPRLGK